MNISETEVGHEGGYRIINRPLKCCSKQHFFFLVLSYRVFGRMRMALGVRENGGGFRRV